MKNLRTRDALVAILYLLAMAGLGGVAAWPIYESLAAVWTIAAGTGAGIALAWFSVRFGWRWWLSTLALVGAWWALGAALAVPARWAGGSMLPGGVIDVLTGPFTGWKDLATVPLPVGEYRNLLVPLLVVALLSVFFAARLAWRDDTYAAFAVPLAALLPFFGLLFGRSSTSQPVQLGPVRLSAPVEMAIGAAALLCSVLWLAWRAREARRGALRQAEQATGIQAIAEPATGAKVRRGVLASAVVLVALAAGVAITPSVADTRAREVLRTAVDPRLSALLATSPLAQYRNNFSDGQYKQVLFKVSGNVPDRIRVATMTSYDGEVYRVAGSGNPPSFQRVPSTRNPGPGKQDTAQIEVVGLRGSWLPMFGSLERVDFEGPNATKLADGFYYDAQTGAGVEAAGVGEGDRYELQAAVPKEASLAGEASPKAKPSIEAPRNMDQWLDGLSVSRDGEGLQSAIQTLRERGYLSHALSRATDTPEWMKPLGDYTFRPSAAGHSVARVDRLFQQLLERQQEVASGNNGESLVAAVGDDEQFAVASAIIAQQFGFESRVVLGFRSQAKDDLTGCKNGECRAGDLSAWIEVKLASGEWTAVDTTPQHQDNPTTQTRRERDPENNTEVRPDTAKEVSPPDPQRQEALNVPNPPQEGADLTALWTAVRIGGLSLLGVLLVCAPFAAILIAKASRRRSRRQDPDPVRAIAGGWDEYVDAAVDVGRPAPGLRTRSEVAYLYGTPYAGELARWADQAVFEGVAVPPERSEQFWAMVKDDRSALRSDIGWWKRLRSALSLKSFTRQLAVKQGRTARGAKRVAPRGGSVATRDV